MSFLLHFSDKKDSILIVKSQLSKKQKVFVGLSGGVDSSVSAALLKQVGYDVTGVFIKVWHLDADTRGLERGLTRIKNESCCTASEDRLDAMRVCAKLDIPFVTLDLEKEYKREVVDYMIREYKAGRTPNPDVMCNKYVKFGAFFDWAMRQGADFVATGHYARINPQPTTYNLQPEKKKKLSVVSCKLLVSSDKDKDQSYFLWTLTQKQLSKTLFPVGNLIKKTEVRELAKKFDLITAGKKDSQGLCFIGKVDMKDFLKEFIKPKMGKVIDENGEIIGNHDGAVFLTIGERHNFKITQKKAEQTRINPSIRAKLGTGHSAEKKPHIDQKPYYVVAKDLKKNTVTVSHKSPDGLLEQASKECVIENVNWTLGVPPDLNKKYQARIRYRQPLQACWLTQIYADQNADKRGSNQRQSASKSASIRVVFDCSQNAITPGQSLVIYDGEVCLGGGVIM
ncbi:MAG: tRNA 2-thiouridine(34) synthase MnmA [Candidatus Paceibacterota bacterium]